MAIVLNFILGIACAVFAFILVKLEAELWVTLMMFALSVVLFFFALYKLNDETDCFSNMLSKRKAKKGKAEKSEKYNIFGENSQPINLVKLTNDVWKLANGLSDSEYKDGLVKRLYISFNEIENLIKRQMKELGYTYQNEVFDMFSEIISHYIMCDDKLTDDEFDIYKRICFAVGHKPLTKSKLIQLRNSTDIDRLRDDVRFFVGCRSDVTHLVYLELLEGICMLSYIGDNSFNENAFYILRTFLFDYFDEVPADWEEYLNLIK